MIKRPKNIEKKPGVYLFKDQQGSIIYIGKAKSMADRIGSYFQNPDLYKVSLILNEATEITTIPTSSELEALYLEAELIKKHQPKFNTLLKEGNPFIYLFFSHGKIPTLSVVRTKTKKGTYIGPFLSKKAAYSVYNFLMETFKLKLCKKKIPHGCLQFHVGSCAGFCVNNFDLEFYQFRFELAKKFLSKQPEAIVQMLDSQIQKSSQLLEFERAKNLLEYKKNFQKIIDTIENIENMPSRQDLPTPSQNLMLLITLQKKLKLQHVPYVIDCFDISHLHGNNIVGSCIRYVNGQPQPSSFRKFQIQGFDDQDDCAALAQMVQRRYKTGAYPNLVIVDGGKGQINAVKPYVGTAELVGLAKREETIISADFKLEIKLNPQNIEDALLLQIRDKTHQFAISYQRTQRTLKLKK